MPEPLTSKRPILLYVMPRRSTFITRDIETLSMRYDVRSHELLTGKAWILPFRMLHQLAWLLMHVAWKREVICHFAGYHSVLPTLLCRRSFVILAGSDASCFPNIQYGNFRKPLYAWATRLSVRWSTRLLPVDITLISVHQTYDPSAPADQGVSNFVPDLQTPHTVIPYGFDATMWQADEGSHREPAWFVCVTAGALPGNAVHYRKGMDMLIEAAKRLPEATFIAVGSPEPSRYSGIPTNLRIEGIYTGAQLRVLFSKATFCVQVSIMEGFPNAVCEGMLCGCVPVVSNIAAMPSIVGDTGFICMHRQVDELVNTLRQAITTPHAEIRRRSIAARARITDNYTVEHRLSALLNQLSSNAGGTH